MTGHALYIPEDNYRDVSVDGCKYDTFDVDDPTILNTSCALHRNPRRLAMTAVGAQTSKALHNKDEAVVLSSNEYDYMSGE
jgi:hypothetical protein